MKTLRTRLMSMKIWSIDSVFYVSLVVLILMYYFGLRQVEMYVGWHTPSFLFFSRKSTIWIPYVPVVSR